MARSLLLLAGLAAHAVAADADWTVEWKIPVDGRMNDLIVSNGEVVDLVWPATSWHTVYQMASETAYDNCDFTGARKLTTENDSPMNFVRVFGVSRTTEYYACGVGSHCPAGQKISLIGSDDPVTDEPTPAPKDLLDIVREDPELSTLAAAVQAAGLERTLQLVTLTLFAPTNAAFEALGQEKLDYLLDPANKVQLVDLLDHHLGRDSIPSDALLEGMIIGTLQDCPIVVGTITPTVTVGGFRGAPDDIMATVTQADILATNGAVHKIDAVLEPLPTVWDIINDAESDPALEQFERRLKEYNLDDNLMLYPSDPSGNPTPWTVFAPTDKALNDFPDWAIDALGKQVIEYHLVEDGNAYSSADLADMDGKKIKTRQGDTIKVKVDATGGVSLEDKIGQEADFVEVDMQACNGVVHAIDTTLLYKNDNSDGALRAGIAVAAVVAALALLV